MSKEDEIVRDLYENITQDIIDIIEDPEFSDFLTILSVISRTATAAEMLFVGNKPLKGIEKKEIVKKLSRFLISQHCQDDLREGVLSIFDTCVDSALEIMIDFAKNNKVLRKTSKCVATSCC